MSAVLTHHSYGKSRVRLTKISRLADRHEVRELEVDVRLEGAFEATYLTGDNRDVIATDSMRNIVYATAHAHPIGPIETFARALADHFLEGYGQVRASAVRVVERPWLRVQTDGRDHPHAFTGGTAERRTASVTLARDAPPVITTGIEGLLLLKTTGSAFTGFVRDHFTTLPESTDRIFATELNAEWHHDAPCDFDDSFANARRALVETFADHDSLSVQQTLHACGVAALGACPSITTVALTMPNKHRILFDLGRFGIDNRNEVFVTTDEPFGVIAATVARSGPASA